MSMRTFLSPQQHPFVELTVPGIDENIILSCLIDTGFGGGISIPLKLKEEFEFPLIGRRTWELADGSEIELEVYLGGIQTDKNTEQIAVIFSNNNEGLVGIEFLRNKKFILDLKSNTIELHE